MDTNQQNAAQSFQDYKTRIGHYSTLTEALAAAMLKGNLVWRIYNETREPYDLVEIYNFAKKYDQEHPISGTQFYWVSREGAIGISMGLEYRVKWMFIPMEPGLEYDDLVVKMGERMVEVEDVKDALNAEAETPEMTPQPIPQQPIQQPVPQQPIQQPVPQQPIHQPVPQQPIQQPVPQQPIQQPVPQQPIQQPVPQQPVHQPVPQQPIQQPVPQQPIQQPTPQPPIQQPVPQQPIQQPVPQQPIQQPVPQQPVQQPTPQPPIQQPTPQPPIQQPVPQQPIQQPAPQQPVPRGGKRNLTPIIAAVVVALLIGGGGFYAYNRFAAKNEAPTQQEEVATTTTEAATPTAETATQPTAQPSGDAKALTAAAINDLKNAATAQQGIDKLNQAINLGGKESVEALYTLAQLYGRVYSDKTALANVEKLLPKDNKKAHELNGKAVALDATYYPSLYELGCDYMAGDARGAVDRDIDKARQYFTQGVQYARQANDTQLTERFEIRLASLE